MRMFNEKLDCKLIALVKNNPVLYNPNDNKYMDFNAREVAWHRIGDELKRPAADCKIRWIHIRDVHRRILRKCITTPRKKMKLYKYHSHLAFMVPFYKELSAQVTEIEEFDNDTDNADDNCDTYNDDVNDNKEDDPIADAASESDDYTDTKPVKRTKKINASRTRKNKMVFEKGQKRIKRNKTTVFDEDTVERKEESNVKNVVLDDVQHQTLFDPKDPVDVFLLNIGATLKTFSAYHLNLAKSKIFSVVQEHEMQQIVEAQPNQSCETVCETKVSTSDHDHLYSC